MNYVSFCRMYFSVTHIPVSLMKKNEAIYSSIGEVCSVKAARYWEMAPIDDTPNFYRYSPDIEYGVGPAFSVPGTSEIIRTYMHENAIALEYQEAVAEFLCTIPRITYQQFSRHLALIHLCLNQKEISVQDLFQQDNEHVRKREEQNVNEIANNIESRNYIKQ